MLKGYELKLLVLPDVGPPLSTRTHPIATITVTAT